MKLQYRGGKLLICLCCAFVIVSLGSCKTPTAGVQLGWPPVVVKDHKGGPPAHAKAHGYRAKHTYRYYPGISAYFDIGRKLYFYLEGDLWRMAVSLPTHLRVHLREYVTIEMDSDKPYTGHEEHRQKYPPGQLKKKEEVGKELSEVG